jgi:23S rRNA-/tRNA-specific pseudouridylate synthase
MRGTTAVVRRSIFFSRIFTASSALHRSNTTHHRYHTHRKIGGAKMTMQTRDDAHEDDDDTIAGGEKAREEERFSPAPLRATTACARGDYRLALKIHGHLTDEEIDRVESKHPLVKTYDVAKEIVPRINYLKFLQERNRLGEEDAKEFVIRQPQCLERKFEIIHEDVKLGYVALNKPFDVRLDTPRGWPGKVRFTPKFDGDASCEDFLAHRFPNEHVRFCHQLDNATSGVLLCALTKKAAGVAAKMFRERRTKKFYSAVVFGWPEEDFWTCTKKIGKDEEDETGFREKVREDEGGKECKTEFEVLKRGYLTLEGKHWNKRVSLVRVRIFTGRRHQIRVHLKDCGFPILGDAAYADDEDTYRTFLHAEDLELYHSVAGVEYDKKTNKKKKKVEIAKPVDSSEEDENEDEEGENMLKLHAPRPSAFEDIISDTGLEA